MAHKKLNRAETGICREAPAWLEGCSSILGLWHKKVLERETNRKKLVAAGFLLPRQPSKPPTPREQTTFAEWEKRLKQD